MKKIVILCLVAALSASMLAGCSKKDEETSTVVSSVTPVEISAEIEVEETDPHEGMAQSYLTGKWKDEEKVNQERPFAIMMGNTQSATPQYGISKAAIVYEAPVEGAMTRLMPIFENWRKVERIESIRSCRLYYIDWALEFDAIYGHYGQAYLAEDMLSNDYVNNLSGLDWVVEEAMYRRDSDRPAPHNAYTTGELIPEGIEAKGYSTKYDSDYSGHYNFNQDEENEIELNDGQAAAVVKPGYLINKPYFIYDQDKKVYYRYQYSEPQIDAIDNSQVSCKNIILQICDWYVADEEHDYLSVDTMSGGKGYYITNGKAVPVTWSKDSQTAPTRYFLEDGTEITLNQGKTWVCIVQDDYADNITFYESKEAFEAE